MAKCFGIVLLLGLHSVFHASSDAITGGTLDEACSLDGSCTSLEDEYDGPDEVLMMQGTVIAGQLRSSSDNLTDSRAPPSAVQIDFKEAVFERATSTTGIGMIAMVLLGGVGLWWYHAAAAVDSAAASGYQPSGLLSLFVQLSVIWPSIFIAGASVGMCMPMESYISLNFFSQQYTSIDHSKIQCQTTPEAKYCKSAVTDNVKWTAILSIASALMHIGLGPALGVFSDANGRKPIIVICAALGLIPSLAQALFVFFDVSLYFWYGVLFLSMLPSLAVWFALISDLVEDPARRTPAFGIVLCAWELSILFGMVIGAGMSIKVTVAVAFLFDIGNIVYLMTCLPETLAPERRTPLKTSQLAPFVGISILGRSPDLRRLCCVFMVNEFVANGLGKISISYFQKYMHWTKADNSFGSILSQVSILMWVGVLLHPIIWYMGELGLLWTGQAVGSVFDACMFFSSTTKQVWGLQGGLLGATSLSFPATAALKGGMVEDDEQGHIQGAVQSAKSMAACVGPLFFGMIFNSLDASGSASEAAKTFAGMPSAKIIFLIGALLRLLTLPVVLAMPRDILKRPRDILSYS